MPVRRVDVESADEDYEEDGSDLQKHHGRVEGRALGDPLHEDERHQRHDENRGQVHHASGPDEMTGGVVDDRRAGQGLRQPEAELREDALEIARPSARHEDGAG